MSQHWTLLRLQPQSLHRYVNYMLDRFPSIPTYYPQHEAMSRPAGHRRPMLVSRPTFPGYIFAKPDFDTGEHYSLTHGIPFRVFFVRFGHTIQSIPESVINELRRLESVNGLIAKSPERDSYRQGQRVHVHLPTTDIVGVIKRIMQNRAIVETIFCTITVPIHQIEPASGSAG